MKLKEIHWEDVHLLVKGSLDVLKDHTDYGADLLLQWSEMLIFKERWLTHFQDASPSIHTQTQIINGILRKFIGRLQPSHPNHHTILDRHYLWGDSDQKIVNNKFPDYSRPKLSKARYKGVEILARAIAGEETELRNRWVGEQINLCPLPMYGELIGRSTPVTELTNLLGNPSNPWLINLTGMGGVGKTAVANATMTQLLTEFKFLRPIWINLETLINNDPDLNEEKIQSHILQQLLAKTDLTHSADNSEAKQLQKLQTLCQAQPHLIIIDGFDIEFEVTNLVRLLQTLTNPTKILLTGRIQLDTKTPLHNLPLHPLSPENSNTLLSKLTQLKSTNALENASEESLVQLGEILNGHPLAIELAAKLAQHHSIEDLIEELSEANLKDTAALYDRLFTKLFGMLDDKALKLMNAMLLVSADGADEEYLMALLGEEKAVFVETSTELQRLSVLRKDHKRYTIHRLTYTHLNKYHRKSTIIFQNFIQNGLGFFQTQLENLTYETFVHQYQNLLLLLKAGLEIPSLWKQTVLYIFSVYYHVSETNFKDSWLKLLNHAGENCPLEELSIKRRLITQYASFTGRIGNHQLAETMYESALSIANEIGDIKAIGHVTLSLASLHFELCRFRKAKLLID